MSEQADRDELAKVLARVILHADPHHAIARRYADATLASDWLAQRDRRVRAEALRRFADSRGVNVGDEDDDYWRGYRQAQRECLHDAVSVADRIEKGER